MKRRLIVDAIPMTGSMDPKYLGMDPLVLSWMREYSVPGAVLALAVEGRVLGLRGYGWCDRALTRKTQPTTLMRAASIEKPIIGTAVKLLMKQKKRLPGTGQPITPGMPYFDAVSRELRISPLGGMTPDPRAKDVTVQHLLDHTSGVEPCPLGWALSDAVGLSTPARPQDLARWVMSHPLRFTPGEKFEYSSTGYELLRFLVHWTTGDYHAFLKREMFGPAGTTDFVQSRTDPALRDPREAYYWYAGTGPSLLPGDHRRTVPLLEGASNADLCMWPAFSAKALALFLQHWFMYQDTTIPDPATGKYPPKGRGGGRFNGAMPGTCGFVIQRFNSWCSLAVLCNSLANMNPGERSWDLCERIEVEVLKPRGV